MQQGAPHPPPQMHLIAARILWKSWRDAPASGRRESSFCAFLHCDSKLARSGVRGHGERPR